MIRMITVVDVAPGHEAELEQEWQSLRAYSTGFGHLIPRVLAT